MLADSPSRLIHSLPGVMLAALLWFGADALGVSPWVGWVVVVWCAALVVGSGANALMWLLQRLAIYRMYDSSEYHWYSAVKETNALAASVGRLDPHGKELMALGLYNALMERDQVDADELDNWLVRFQASIQAEVEEVDRRRRYDLLEYAAQHGDYLPAVRDVSGKSRDYRAEAINALVNAGAAQPAAGSRPAKITDYAKAREVLR